MSESGSSDPAYPKVVVLSGRIAAGKTTLAHSIVDRLGGRVIPTSNLLAAHARHFNAKPPDLTVRANLQAYGRALDEISGGSWLARDLAILLPHEDPSSVIVIDSIRMPEQLPPLREKFGDRLLHVHLTAPEETLLNRFERRGAVRDEGLEFEDVAIDRTEAQVEELGKLADLVIDTSVVAGGEATGLVADLLERLDDQLEQ